MTIQLANYLFFTTCCEDALAFYAECGLGRVVELLRYGENGMPAGSEAMRGKIMHAKFEGPDTVRTWASTTDVFKEDAFMLEQQQLRLNNYDTDKLLNINTDVARVRMIRALNDRLRREQAAVG